MCSKFQLILLFLLVNTSLFANGIFQSEFPSDGNNRIVILHPTTSNIRHFNYLIEHGIIDIENNEVIGVYYKNETYNYKNSEEYIKEKKITSFKLFCFEPNIHPDSLFIKNQGSELYHTIFKHSKGIIFCGGPDLPPSVYGSKKHLTTNVSDPQRNIFELSFMNHLLGGSGNEDPFLNENPYYSVTGICLGMQTMNVATGGSLWQDIPSQFYNQAFVEDVYTGKAEQTHKAYAVTAKRGSDSYSGVLHHIKAVNGGRLSKLVNNLELKEVLVNSKHHQCVKDLGDNIQVEALSLDGKIIEGISHRKFPNVIGFQFHPEDSELYREERSYKLAGSTGQIYLHKQLERDNSMVFHLKLWQHISMTYNQPNIEANLNKYKGNLPVTKLVNRCIEVWNNMRVTDYTHDYGHVIEDKGIYKFDCSGFVTEVILADALPKHYKELKDNIRAIIHHKEDRYVKHTRPLVASMYDYFDQEILQGADRAENENWEVFTSIESLQKGDLILRRYSDKWRVKTSNLTTGHIMICWESQRLSQNFWKLQIFDSTSSIYKGSVDTRVCLTTPLAGDRIRGNHLCKAGIGFGWILGEVDENNCLWTNSRLKYASFSNDLVGKKILKTDKVEGYIFARPK